MRTYEERKVGAGSEYGVRYVSEGGRDIFRKSRITLASVKKDGTEQFLLYDGNMAPVKSVCNYLNSSIGDSPINTRRQAATALKLLWTYLDLENLKDPSDLTPSLLNGFICALRGIGPSQEVAGLLTDRKAETVNAYLSTYRKFCRTQGYECPALEMTKGTYRSISESIIHSPSQRRAYASTVRNHAQNIEVPRYITKDEFKRLWSVARSHGDQAGAIVIYLMYLFGLRIGEVLGLTLEDIHQEYREDVGTVYTLVLRNRTSDDPSQHAKNLMHVQSRKQYGHADYRASYDTVMIDEGTYNMISLYVEAAHSEAEAGRPERYARSKADIVSKDFDLDENHYVFLNKFGGPLTGSAWGKRMRAYFKEAGIPIDYGTRRNNLNHRLRAGFAMWHARDRKDPVSHLELQRMLRHRSPMSVMSYYVPTEKDVLDSKLEFLQFLTEGIKGLGL